MSLKSMFGLIVAGCLTLAVAGAAVFADHHGDKKAKPTTTPATTQAAKALGNKFCPVMPEDEVSKKWSVVYEGEKIGLCCRDCVKDFNDDPEKYAEVAREDAKKNAKSEKKS